MANEPEKAAQPLACDLHDYVEIACLFNYHVVLNMRDESVFEGIAKNSRRNGSNQECLILESINDPNINSELVLTEIETLRVVTKNARFSQVNFS